MTTSPKSRLVAGLLAFFVGPLGIHRMYVGKTGSGIAQLVLTIVVIGLPVSAIWGFVDFIMIVAGTFTDKAGRTVLVWDPAANAATAASAPTSNEETK